MDGKNKVLNYCSQFKMPDLEHIEHAIDNKRMIERGEYRHLNGCPSSFGFDDHEGLCETEDYETLTNQEQYDMCERCWKQALGVK